MSVSSQQAELLWKEVFVPSQPDELAVFTVDGKQHDRFASKIRLIDGHSYAVPAGVGKKRVIFLILPTLTSG